MDKTGLIDKTKLLLSFEKEFVDTLRSSPQQGDVASAQRQLFQHLQDVGKSDFIDEILDVELYILQNEHTHFSNSAAMANSLDAAIQEVRQCQYMLEVVRNPEEYAKINRSLALPKSRSGVLPFDDARKAFRGHATRLNNLDRSRLTESEKNLLMVRHKNVGIAEKLYIDLQRHALGVAPIEQAKSAGIEM